MYFLSLILDLRGERYPPGEPTKQPIYFFIMKPTTKPSKLILTATAAMLAGPATIYAFFSKMIIRSISFFLLALELIFTKFFLVLFCRLLAFIIPLTIITILLYNIVFN